MLHEQKLEVHVGCDSQNYKRHTVYATTVVFDIPGNGAHVIYRKEKVPKINDLWTKLWGETERSVAWPPHSRGVQHASQTNRPRLQLGPNVSVS
jgi:predicted RNase H-related nuclease YkuK (DUF458 family)